MSTSKIPPVEAPNFDHLTPEKVVAETEEIINTTSALRDELVATIAPASATFANVIRPIVDDENRAACRLYTLSELLSQLSPNQQVRQAARQAESKITAARTRNLMRRDVAALVFAVYEREISTPSNDLDAQDRHLLSSIRGRYVRSGAGLELDQERERFRAASDELSAICGAVQDTLIEPEEGVWFERAELAGVPETMLATMIEDGTRIQVSFSKQHTGAVMGYATSSNTRHRLLIANWNRLPQNIKRLADAVALRDEIARLLGYEHHAALKIEGRMASNVAYVEAQLEDLHKRLKPVGQARTDHLLELKRMDPNNDENPVSELYEWEKAYYGNKQKKDGSSVDYELLAEYFEAKRTLQAMLTVFHDLFGMDFLPIATSVWHDSVIPYQVWDTESEGDLFAREGKYRGAHCVGIQPGFIEHDGTKHYPATVLVCSYANPSPSRPTLLQHSEVTTMFHELGHAIHSLVSKTKYAISHSRDYSEIPSIMLENWTWVPDVLVRLGRHYTAPPDGSDTEGALPRDLAEAACATRNSNRANAILNHVWPALFDLAIHTPPTHIAALEMNTTETWNITKQRIITTSCGHNPRDWGAGQARFIHMFRHNDAGYFSYPLSMAYAADLFASAFAKDPMNPVEGRRWRYQVLEPGSSRSEMGILEDYLGRKPSIKAILDELKA